MATVVEQIPARDPADAAELTLIGKRIEILRIERGLSKQRLARHAATSRQQLWRVMTGKSDLTSALRERLAAALGVDSAIMVVGEGTAVGAAYLPAVADRAAPSLAGSPTSVGDYLTDPRYLAVTLRTLPGSDGGRRLKRALLNALEDLAVDTNHALPLEYSEIRRRVLAEEL